MKPNVGSADRFLRFLLGLALIVGALLPISPLSDAPVQQALVSVLGIVLLGTASMRFCPLYKLFGLSTCRARH